jgi:hypothetical protein
MYSRSSNELVFVVVMCMIYVIGNQKYILVYFYMLVKCDGL